MGSKPKARSQGSDLLIGIDLGGTKILAALVDRQGKILAEAKRPTKADLGQDGVIKRIVETVKEAVQLGGVSLNQVRAAGIGAPAPANPDEGLVYNPPNLPGWGEVALGPRLAEALGLPVLVDNDVNLGTLGEYVSGAGRGASTMVGIFVGTGVGGGLVLDGKLHRGFRYAAGELGHMIMVPNGPVCGCGRRGCLEAVASRTAMERDIRLALAAGRPSVVADLLAASKKDRITSGLMVKALAEGDSLMQEVLGAAQFYLGLMAANIVNLLDPEMIVFGGGVIEALGDEFLEPIRQAARPNFLQQRAADQVRIVPAVLGDYAGIVGAAFLAGQLGQKA